MNKEDLELTLQNVRTWIGLVDQKVNILLVLQFGVLAIVLKPAYDLLTGKSTTWNQLSLLILVFAVCFYVYSIVKLAIAIKPRVKSEQKESLIFFGSIASMNLDDYKKAVNKSKKKDYKNDLISQISVTSKISNLKHQNYTDALILFGLSILLLGLLIMDVNI